MSVRLGDGPLITPVAGSVTVVGSSSTPVRRLGAGPETDPEKTLPMRPISGWVLLWQAILFRLPSWCRPRAVLKLTAAAVPVVLAVLLFRTPDTDSRNNAQAGTDSPATAMSTGTPVPPLPVPHGSAPITAQEDPSAIAPRVPSAQELAGLPKAVIGAAMKAAPVDPAPSVTPGSTVLHPTQDVPVYSEPGGCAFAVLPARQVVAPTWVPVVERRPGWVLVLLPTRPQPASAAPVGWIHLHPAVELAESDRRVEVDVTTGRVSVLAVLGGTTTYGPLGATRPAGTVSQAVPATGTRSFVAIGGQTAELPWPLRLVWPFVVDTGRVCTGTFSAVSIPGMPAVSPLGSLDGDGCVPAPPALHSALAQVPSGTPVLLR